nr:unnamed protein product [Digitaria exilis]
MVLRFFPDECAGADRPRHLQLRVADLLLPSSAAPPILPRRAPRSPASTPWSPRRRTTTTPIDPPGSLVALTDSSTTRPNQAPEATE